MNPELAALHVRIKRHFKDALDESMFKGSLGEHSSLITSVDGLLGFLAIATAALCYTDQRYAATCVSLHAKLIGMHYHAKNAGDEARQWLCLHTGSIIERALRCVAKLHDEDGAHPSYPL